jgi:hypothetical protein
MEANRIQRMPCLICSHCFKLVESIGRLEEALFFHNEVTYSIDETFLQSNKLDSLNVVERNGKTIKCNKLVTDNEKLRTCVLAIVSNGTVVMTLLIFKKTYQVDSARKTTMFIECSSVNDISTFPIYYASKDSGYMTALLWEKFVTLFLEVIRRSQVGCGAFLYIDHHTSHHTEASLLKLLQNDVHSFFLPHHTTHILQPLDNLIFAGIKNEFRKQTDCQVINALYAQERGNQRCRQQNLPNGFTKNSHI